MGAGHRRAHGSAATSVQPAELLTSAYAMSSLERKKR